MDEIGGYRLVRRLGAGGMGTVWEALDAEDRPVALKLLHPHISNDPGARARLEREVALLHRVRGPRISRVLDAEVEAAEAFVVTELIDGLTLDDDVRTRGPFAPHELSALARGLAEALDSIHSVGVVHRDLKPSNVMISATGPVIIDFGIAQVADDVRLTQTGMVTGTPGYLDPQVADGAPPSARGDWWAWAAVLVFAATGRQPFGTGPNVAIFQRLHTGSVDVEGLEPDTARALRAALHPDPAARLAPTHVLAVLEGDLGGRDLTSLLATLGPTPGSSPHVSPSGFPDDDASAPPITLPPLGPPPVPAPPAAPGRTRILPAGPRTTPTPTGKGSTQVVPGRGGDAGARGRGRSVQPSGSTQVVGPPGRGSVVAPRTQAVGPPAYGGDVYGGDVAPSAGYGDPYAAGVGYGPGVPPSGAVVESTPAWLVPPEPRTGMVAAVGVLLAAAGMVWPGPVIVVFAGLLLGAASIGYGVESLRRARLRRGLRSGDVVRAVLGAPWHLLRGLLLTVFLLVVGLGVGWLVLQGAYLAVPALRAGGEPMVHQVASAGGVALMLLAAWFAPGSERAREGARVALGASFPFPLMRVLLVLLCLGLAVGVVFAVLAGGLTGVDWSPLPAPVWL